MNTRQLRLIISAQNQTAGAFGDLQRQLSGIQYQLAFFNRHSLDLPRTFSQGFLAMGQSVQFFTQLLGQGSAAVATFVKGAADGFKATAARAQVMAAVFQTSGNTLASAMMSSFATAQAATGRNLDLMGNAINHVGGIFRGLGNVAFAVFSIIGSAINIALQALGGLLEIVVQVAQAVGGVLSEAFHILGGAATAAALTLGALTFITAKAGIEFDSFREQTLLTFEVMFKSADVARQKFEWLKHFADITPFDTRETIEAGKTLAAYGLNIEHFLTVAGNMAVAFNKPLEQAIRLLGQASAGIFQTRTFAPLGITRARLESVGVDFKKSGVPVDRSQILPGVEAIVARDFPNLMERQSQTMQGLFSTVKAFFTEELPGAIVAGLYSATKALMQFLVNYIFLIRQNGQLNVLADGLGRVFTTIGAIAQMAASQIPAIINWFTELVQTGRWENFLRQIYSVFVNLYQFIVNGLKWVGENWDTVWGGIEDITFGFIKIVGGLFAGLVNVIKELVEGGWDLNKTLLGLGDSVKQFTLTAIDAFGHFVTMLFIVQTVVGFIQIALGALMGAVPVVIQGITNAAVGVAGIFGTAAVGNWLTQQVIGFDPSKLIPNMGKVAQDRGPVGAFVRGYQGFGAGVDQFRDDMHKGHALPTPAFAGPDMQIGGGMPADVMDQQKRALDDAKDHVKDLQAAEKAWGHILDAAKSYGDTLSNHGLAIQMELHAMFGLLNAHNELRAAQEQLLKLQDVGNDDWWKTLGGINENIKAANTLRDKIRDVVFETERLKALSSFQDKMVQLAKDLGLPMQQMNLVIQDALQTQLQLALVERNRLSTMEAGTTEWIKQRERIVDIVTHIVQLRRELGEANKLVQGQGLRSPLAPFGMRGAAFGPEVFQGGTQPSQLAADVGRLLSMLLNPRPTNLDSIAGRYGAQFPDGQGGADAGMVGATPGLGLPSLPGQVAPETLNTNGVLADQIAAALRPLFDQLCDCICHCGGSGGSGNGNRTSSGGPATSGGWMDAGGGANIPITHDPVTDTFGGFWKTQRQGMNRSGHTPGLQSPLRGPIRVTSGMPSYMSMLPGLDQVIDTFLGAIFNPPPSGSMFDPRSLGDRMPIHSGPDVPTGVPVIPPSLGGTMSIHRGPDVPTGFDPSRFVKISPAQVQMLRRMGIQPNAATTFPNGQMVVSNEEADRIRKLVHRGDWADASMFGIRPYRPAEPLAPPHQFPHDPLQGSSVTTVPSLQVPSMEGWDPWHFWNESEANNAARNLPAYGPHGRPQSFWPTPLDEQQPGPSPSVSIGDVNIFTSSDEAEIRRVASQVFEVKLDEAINKIRARRTREYGKGF